MSDIDPIVAEFISRLGSDSATSLIHEYSSRYPNLGTRLTEALEQAARDWNAKPWDESQVDSLCIEFGEEFKKGLTPEIEPWLNRVPKSSQSALLTQLIAEDVYQRTRRGEKIDWEAYKNRFPTLLASVEQAFEDFQPDQRQTPGSRDPGDVSTDMFIPAGGLGKLLVNRYRLDRLLGSGTFGIVFLAFDTVLNRQVAIKVRKNIGNSKQSNDSYLEEAQFAAGLRHPNIVTVFTVERTPSDELFIVSEYIEGGTLKDHIDAQDFDYPQIAKTILSVAEALGHAHQRGLIHRDIKPANILVEASTRNAFVVDFGLATREFEYLQRSDGAGSPAYKSPEQIRREGHKLDGRSDLFSLGIVFYELLTGKRPFVGSTISETENRILYAEPIPPNDHKSDIPAELERICMKLLRKVPNDRHSSGAQVAEELRDWLAPKTIAMPASTDEPAKVIPRGLRSYSDEDAGFFLDLLPGERDRQGLPESVAFWKKKIEQRDPEKTFGLGMLIGPSGSGKSSLVKAGIVPRLPSKIFSIHLDSTAEDTEERLLQSLKKRFTGLQEVSTLTEAFLWIRTRIEPKVVLWFDQFEQWLSSGFDLKHSDLVDALRQCDGRTLQAVLMVRDDFFMASNRLMDALDVRLIKGENFMTVDLFDQDHAVKVLFTFGKAYGRIPSETEFPPSGGLKAFIESAVGGLAEGGKVVSVRLALFAQMVKDKDWE
ncbi:MAG: serine/threonine-protein kinase, partial [Pirellula sp.]